MEEMELQIVVYGRDRTSEEMEANTEFIQAKEVKILSGKNMAEKIQVLNVVNCMRLTK